MKEQDFEDILSKYPELVEEGLALKGRQVYVRGKYVDLLFEDRHGQTLIVELKKGTIRREHTSQLLDYEGHFLSPDDHPVRVMLVGNRVPHNLRRSLDYHGFEWREITVTSLIEFLEEKDDKEYLAYFQEEDLRPRQRITQKKSLPIQKTGSRTGLPRLQDAQSFSELGDIIRARYPTYPTDYMDLLLLENKDKPLSAILEEFQQYAKQVDYQAFENMNYLLGHIRYRESRGWVFDYSGDQENPIVRLVGFEPDQVEKTTSASITIYQKFLNVLKGQEGKEFSRSEIIDRIVEEYPGTNRTSLIPSDYCYNITNKGIPFKDHIFEYIGQGRYKYLGQNYEYTGLIFWKDKVVGEWSAGKITRDPSDTLTPKSTTMKPSKASFWNLLLEKTREVCAREGLELDLRVGSEGRFAKAPTGIAGVSWSYAISRSTAWVELEIKGRYRDEVYGRLSQMQTLANRQFQSEIGERIYWDKEAHYSGKEREVYRITSDSNYPLFDNGKGWDELVDDLISRMIAFVKVFDGELQSIADAKS